MSSELNTFLEELYRAGGGRTAPRRFNQFLLAASVDSADAVLHNPDVFHKQYGAMDTLFRSRLNTDGHEWRARRTLTQDHYNAAAAPRNRQKIVGMFDKALDETRCPTTSLEGAIGRALITATLRVFFDAFGADHDTSDLAAGTENLRKLVHAIELTSLSAHATPSHGALSSQTAAVHRDLRLYAANEPGVERVVTRLGRDDDAAGLETTGELLGNLVAGSESSASVLCWAMLLIGGFPDVQERLREEACADGERSATTVFLNEVLRLFPPFPMVTRVAVRDFSSAAFSAREGDSVLVSIIGIHLDSAFWSSPRRFDPERPEFVGRTFNRKAFIPFLHGPRVCGGASLARAELVEGFSALLRRFRFRRTSAETRFQYAAVLRPVLEGALSAERL